MISALLFGAYHLAWWGTYAPSVVAYMAWYTFVDGLLYATLTLRTRSIGPAIALHGIQDASFFVFRMRHHGQSWTGPHADPWSIGLQLVVVAYAVWLLRGATMDDTVEAPSAAPAVAS